MTRSKGVAVVMWLFTLGACAQVSDNGSHAGSGAATAGKSAAGSGGAHAGSGGSGKAGTGSGDACGNIAIPALCRQCADGKCGAPTCSAGKFTGFVCPEDGSGGAAGSGGGVCNLLCVKGKHCVANPKPTCVDDTPDAGASDAGSAPTCGGIAGLPCPGSGQCEDVPNDSCDPNKGGADCPSTCTCPGPVPCPSGSTFDASPNVCACTGTGSGLHWFASCGFPVCRTDDGMYDDPNIPNCTTEKEGQSCATENQRCDGVLGCGETLICAQQAPTACPKSRAAFKQDIRYLDEAQRASFHDQITQLRLASYRYKTAPDVPQLGFMIDDVEPSVAAAGDHVNLYAYLSMAVAAIQVQDEQIKTLQRELEALRANHDAAPVCEAAAGVNVPAR
jgi:hypothetical protein